MMIMMMVIMMMVMMIMIMMMMMMMPCPWYGGLKGAARKDCTPAQVVQIQTGQTTSPHSSDEGEHVISMLSG